MLCEPQQWNVWMKLLQREMLMSQLCWTEAIRAYPTIPHAQLRLLISFLVLLWAVVILLLIISSLITPQISTINTVCSRFMTLVMIPASTDWYKAVWRSILRRVEELSWELKAKVKCSVITNTHCYLRLTAYNVCVETLQVCVCSGDFDALLRIN